MPERRDVGGFLLAHSPVDLQGGGGVETNNTSIVNYQGGSFNFQGGEVYFDSDSGEVFPSEPLPYMVIYEPSGKIFYYWDPVASEWLPIDMSLGGGVVSASCTTYSLYSVEGPHPNEVDSCPTTLSYGTDPCDLTTSFALAAGCWLVITFIFAGETSGCPLVLSLTTPGSHQQLLFSGGQASAPFTEVTGDITWSLQASVDSGMAAVWGSTTFIRLA